MSEIDNRVVSMTFDNATFEKRLSATLTSLDKLSESLRFAGAEKGFGNVAKAANGVDLSKIAAGVSNISSKFSAMGAVGFTVLQSLTRGVLGFVSKMANIAKTDVLGPIITGGTSRAQNIEQAQFMFEGLGINVEKGMASAKEAVLGTAFGLDEAAKAAAQFGASGIKVGEEMTSSLRGVAGAAALTGSSFTEIADIFAGSAGSGLVNNMDLQQFSTRGLNAAAAIGPILHKTEKQIHEMATNGELDFKTFAGAMDKAFGAHAKEANKTYTGSLANMRAAMSRLGASFIGPKERQQRDLFNALTPAIDNVNKALQPLINTFLGIRQIGVNSLIKAVNNLDLTNFKKAMPNIQKGLLNIFDAFGRIKTVAIGAFRDIFPKSSVSIIITISKFFKDFTEKLKIGGSTATNVRNIFRGIFSVMAIGFNIMKAIVGSFVNLFSILGNATGITGNSILGFFGNIGQALNALRSGLVTSQGITNFFKGLALAIKNPLGFITALKNTIVDFFKNITIRGPKIDGVTNGLGKFFGIFKKFDPKFTNSMDGGFKRLGDRLDFVAAAMRRVGAVFSWFWDKLVTLKDFVINTTGAIIHWFADLGPNLAKALKSDELDAILKVLNTLFLGIGASGFSKLAKNGLGLNLGIKGSGGFFTSLTESVKGVTGTLKSVKGILDGVTGTLKAMQTEVKAKALLKIAIALGILTASLTVLSMIDPKALASAMTAMAVGFGQLVASMAILDKSVSGPAAAAKLSIIAGGLILLASAMVILATAMKIFATMSFTDLAKGLIGVGGSLVVIAGAMHLMPSGPAMIAQSVGLIAIGVALSLIAGSMKIFATISWGDMAKGLVGVAGSLTLIAVAMNLMPSGPAMLAQSVGLIAIGVSLNLIAASMKIFGTMSWGEIGKGLLGIGGGLVVIAGAMHLMPINIPITAAGILILSVALNVMAKAVKSMGSNDLGTLAKGIGAFAAMLLVLALAMNAMTGALPGAAATLIVSAALLVMTGVLERLSALKVGDIIKGLLTLAGIFLVFGLASIALAGAIGPMIGLGVALGILGAAFALFGFGAAQIVKAIEVLAKVGVTGARAFVAALTILETAIPEIIKSVVESIKSLATELLTALPVIVKLVVTLVDSLLTGIIKEAPKLAQAVLEIINGILLVIRESFPDFVKTGFELLISFLTGIRDNIVEIVTLAGEIIVSFITALIAKMPDLVTAAVDLITSFLHELGNHAEELVTAGTDVLVKFLSGLTKEVGKIVAAVAFLVTTFIAEIGKHYLEIINAGTDALVNFLKGIGDNLVKVTNTVGDVIARFIAAVGENFTKIATAGADAIIKFFNGMKDRGPKVVTAISEAVTALILALLAEIGKQVPLIADGAAKMIIAILDGLAKAIRDNAKQMGEAWANVAEAMVDGFGDAFVAAMKKLIKDKIPGPLQGLVNIALKITGSHSPSRVFYKIGENVVLGLSNGITDNSNLPIKAIDSTGRSVIKSMSNTISKISDSLRQDVDFNPVITPVLDLTKIQSASNTISGYLKVAPIVPDVSLTQARVISASSVRDRTPNTTPIKPEPTVLTFEQNNYSPKALSTNDIYRNTKSQIALAKEELDIK